MEGVEINAAVPPWVPIGLLMPQGNLNCHFPRWKSGSYKAKGVDWNDGIPHKIV